MAYDGSLIIRDNEPIAPHLIKTDHFQQRQAQRQVSDAAVSLALLYGDVFFQGEDRVYFLGRRHIPGTIPDDIARHLNGTTVVLGPENVLVTTFRNPFGRQALKRRSNGVKNGIKN